MQYITIFNEKTHREHHLHLLYHAEYSTTDEFMIEYITQHRKQSIVFYSYNTSKTEEQITQQVAGNHKTLLQYHKLGTLHSTDS